MLAYAAALLKDAEKHRREPGLVHTSPIVGVEDYAEAAQTIATAMGHLDESLPNGQRTRSLTAAIALQAGASALLNYMHAAGYMTGEVPQAPLSAGVDFTNGSNNKVLELRDRGEVVRALTKDAGTLGDALKSMGALSAPEHEQFSRPLPHDQSHLTYQLAKQLAAGEPTYLVNSFMSAAGEVIRAGGQPISYSHGNVSLGVVEYGGAKEWLSGKNAIQKLADDLTSGKPGELSKQFADALAAVMGERDKVVTYHTGDVGMRLTNCWKPDAEDIAKERAIGRIDADDEALLAQFVSSALNGLLAALAGASRIPEKGATDKALALGTAMFEAFKSRPLTNQAEFTQTPVVKVHEGRIEDWAAFEGLYNAVSEFLNCGSSVELRNNVLKAWQAAENTVYRSDYVAPYEPSLEWFRVNRPLNLGGANDLPKARLTDSSGRVLAVMSDVPVNTCHQLVRALNLGWKELISRGEQQ